MKTFVVPLADLERGPKHIDWIIERRWLDSALEGSEAQARGNGSIVVTLNKNGREVMVRGLVKAPLAMPCARTLEPVDVNVDADLFLMLSPAPSASSAAKHLKRRDGRAAGSSQKAIKGPRAYAGRLAKERLLSEEEAAQDFYSGDEIVLDGFIREFILLELPMVPLRSDLRSIDNPAIPGPPEEANAGTGPRVDPRLAPLAEIAGRLKHDTKE